MATIARRQTNNGPSYQVKIRIAGYPPQSASFARLTDAKIWAKKTETELRDGRYLKSAESRKHSVAEVIDRYVRDVLPTKKDTIAPTRQLGWWKNRIGHLVLADVTPAVLSDARDALLREPTDWSRGKRKKPTPRSPSTVNRYTAAISHVFTVAVREWQWMEFNPVSQISKKKEPKGRVRYLNDDERERLLTACHEMGHPFLYAAVVISLSTGARQGEIMRLRWEDVDVKEGKITLYDTKNGDIRALPLRGLALEQMRGLFKSQTVGSKWVFPGQPNAKTGEVRPIDLRVPWLNALKSANINYFRWHDLRHSAASYLAMNGASLTEIAAILGHKQLSMVQRYAHLSPQHTASIVESMNEKIFGSV